MAKSIRPLPIVKEKDGDIFDAFTDKEQRYRNRHLDLILNPEVKDIHDFVYKDFTLENYDPHPHIKAPVAV